MQPGRVSSIGTRTGSVQRGAKLADILVAFGERLRKIRKRKGLSQEKLAELAGLHRTYVSSIERGERNISLENIKRLAQALDAKLRDLMPD